MRAAASTWPRATGPVDVDHEAEAATVGAHGREYVTHTHTQNRHAPLLIIYIGCLGNDHVSLSQWIGRAAADETRRRDQRQEPG